MNPIRLTIAAFLAAASVATAELRTLTLRVYLHDPVHPRGVDLSAAGPDDAEVPLPFRAGKLSLPVEVQLEDHLLLLRSDDGKPAASTKVPATQKRAVAIVLPDPDKESAPPYRVVLVDDAPDRFRWGESRAVNLLGIDAAIEAGEHRVALRAGRTTAVPAVRQVNEFNIAQTNFFYRSGEEWLPFTERQLQYVDDSRRIFLIHATPGSRRPFVTTLVDYQPVDPGAE